MSRHLETQEDFVKAFASFQTQLAVNNVILKDEENVCRLFDMWLANVKDERMLESQLKKEPWEDNNPGF